MMLSKTKLQETLFRIRDKVGLLEAPRNIQWMATHKCNLNCKHCMVNAGNPLQDELSTDEIKTFIKDISKMGVKTFFITGGEPLIRNDIFEILDYAKKQNLITGMATNGTLIPKFKKEISSSNLNSVMVSLDGLEKTHKKIRGANVDYDKLLNSIKFLKNTKISKIGVCTTVNSLNLLELEQLKDLILSLNIDIWRINITLPRGRAKDKLLLNDEEIKKLIKFIEDNSNKIKFSICSEAGYFGNKNKKIRGNSYFFCSCGWTSCTLMANGDIMACPIYEKNNFVEGNIRKKSFKEIWENGLNKFRNLPLNEKCSNCHYLSNCGGGCKVMRILNVDCITQIIDSKPK